MMERSPERTVMPVMAQKFFSIVVVRSIEESVEIVVEAPSADDAHAAALQHLQAKGDEYTWQKPRSDLTVWHNREIDTPAIVDVTA
jgi:hypothetical protein